LAQYKEVVLRIGRAGRIFALVLLLTTVGCDRVTKQVATSKLAGRPGVSYLADTFRLQYAENPGAFLSLGSELPAWARTGLLTVLAGVGLVVIAVAMFKLHWVGLSRIGGILYIAGGASNLVDRIVRGSVVDFMNVGLGPVRTGIFNVADVALMAGVLLIVVGSHYRTNVRTASSVKP
jgi:signal peptidase II